MTITAVFGNYQWNSASSYQDFVCLIRNGSIYERLCAISF